MEMNMPLATVLTKSEERLFNLPPKLNYSEQRYFFTLPKSLNEKTMSYDDSNIVIFVMMYGCFKATNRFYTVDEYIKANYNFIAKEYKVSNIDSKIVSIRRLQQYQQIIKEYFGIREYTEEIQQKLQIEANNLASNFIHRKKVFYSLVDLARKLKIEVPSYTELTKIITIALSNQKIDILTKLESFPKTSFDEIIQLMTKNDEYKNIHHIVNYKKLEHCLVRTSVHTDILP